MQFKALADYLDSLPSKGVPGCDLIVLKDHETIYRHFSGESHPGKPVTGNETYWLYSASKVFTMTALMQQVERGNVKLSDPVSKYLPAYANLQVREGNSLRPAKTVMTVEHLATMQGGLDYDLASPSILACLKKNPNASTCELAEAFIANGVNFDPGTRFCYSLCHDVAAAVVEVASGMPFDQYLKENITDPLGMQTMTFAPGDAEFARLAARYRWDADENPIQEDNGSVPYQLSPKHASGGAGLMGDVASYVLLADALANGGVGRTGARILSQASIDDMRTNRLTGVSLADFDAHGKVGYGYALGVRTLIDITASRSPLGEFGWDGAAGAYTVIDPENHIAVFYAQHVLNCGRCYSEFHPAIRDLIYEALGI